MADVKKKSSSSSSTSSAKKKEKLPVKKPGKKPDAATENVSCFKKFTNTLAYPFTQQDPEENLERGNWANPVEFILACLGYAVGLGNVWRFPYVVYEYGGGTFLLVYWLIFFLVAFPTFFLELHLGQFSSSGPIAIFRNLSPALEGLGYATLGVQILAAIYYNALLTYSLFYVGSSMQKTMPWDTCSYSWNSKECFTLNDYKNWVGNNSETKWYIKQTRYDQHNITEFTKGLDRCIMDSETTPLSPICKVKLDFDLEKTENFSIGDLLGKYDFTGHLFLQKDTCMGQWEYPKDPLDYSSTRDDKGDKKKEVMVHLRQFVGAPSAADWGSPVSMWISRYCSNRKPEEETNKPVTLVQCVREIVRPGESFSSQEYFNAHLAHPDANIYDLKGFFYPLPLAHILAWLVVSVAVMKGPQWMGKLVYVTAIFPIVMMFVLLIFSWTLDGYKDGVAYYMRTDFCRLANPQLWLTAMTQMFFSLSIGGGGLMTLASYNKFSNDVLRDALIVAFGNCLFSFVAGFGIFGFIGFMAKSVNSDMEDILRGGGSSLAFVTLAQATTVMPGKQFWSILFFLMLGFLAVDSEFAMLETVLTFIFDEFQLFRKYKVPTVIGVGILGYCLSLPMVSRWGLPLLGIVDGATFNFLVPMCCLLELVAVGYIYGIRNFMDDVALMFGKNTASWQIGPWIWKTPIKWYLAVTLVSFAPLAVGFLFVTTIVYSYIIPGFEKTILEQVISWSIGIGILPLAIGSLLLFNLIYRGLPWRDLCKPRDEWGPALNENRSGRFKQLEKEAWGTGSPKIKEEEAPNKKK